MPWGISALAQVQGRGLLRAGVARSAGLFGAPPREGRMHTGSVWGREYGRASTVRGKGVLGRLGTAWLDHVNDVTSHCKRPDTAGDAGLVAVPL